MRAVAQGRHSLCDLKCVEDLVSDRRRFLDAFQAGSPFLPFVMAVIRALGTGGYDQKVVFDTCTISELHAF